MSAYRFGATEAEWKHFQELGLVEDLLPIVCNPKAEISHGSQMQTITGKTPSRYNSDRKAAGFARWPEHRASTAHVTRWSQEPDYGIGIQARTVRALDVDVEDAVTAAEILAVIRAHINPPVRSRENSPKFLAAFLLSGEYGKRIIKTAHGAIEFLAGGQQWVAAGTHKSGARYQWDGGLPAAVPPLTPEAFETLFDALQQRFGIEPPLCTTRGARVLGAHLGLDDPVVHFLEENEIVLGDKSDGALIIRCPWESEHTTGETGDGSTVYFPAGVNGVADPGFKCLHGHCADRKLPDFLNKIEYKENLLDHFEVVESEAEVTRRYIDALIAAGDLISEPDELLGEVRGKFDAAAYAQNEYDDLVMRLVSATRKPEQDIRKALGALPRARFASTPITELLNAPPPVWLIKRILPKADLGVLYGETGSGKSFMVLDMLLAIARGVPWRDRKTVQGQVTYICAEGAGGLNNRLKAYSQQHKIDLATVPFRPITRDVSNLLNDLDYSALAKQINAEGGADLIVIDTLAQTTPGGSENSSDDMGKAISHCRGLAKITGAMVLVIHHAGKNLAAGARGWSGLKAAADVELCVERTDSIRFMHVTKAKDAGDFEKFGFKLQVVPLGLDEDEEVVSSCVIEHSLEPVLAEKKIHGRVQRLVLEAVRDLEGISGDLPTEEAVVEHVVNVEQDAVSGPEKWDARARRNKAGGVRKAVDVLVRDGVLVKIDGCIGVWGALKC